ncbi:MAG: CHAD domain-containing protein [Streptosporangiaceae bacterium]
MQRRPEVVPIVNAVREFILASGAPTADDGLPSIDDPRFAISAGTRSGRLRRSWLDTFDWRLFRAGLILEYRLTRAGHGELLLTDRDGDPVAAETLTGAAVAVPKRPFLPGALPLGPVRERLMSVTAIRAMLPVVTATSTLIEHRAVNTDDKTIARIVVERMTVLPASKPGTSKPGTPKPGAATDGAPAPGTSDRIAIIALRGYQAQADRFTELVEQAPGFGPAAHSAFETALAAAGRRPGDYTSKINVELTGDMPAEHALAAVLGRLFEVALANRDGTIADIDTEFLHDLRVSVRRTRSVLKIARSALPPSLTERYRPEFKWLGDLTTPTRDLDVFLLTYPSMADGLIGANADELEPFRDYLRHQRTAAHRKLVRGLRSARFTRLAEDWQHGLARLASSSRPRPVTGPYAAGRIARTHRSVLRAGAEITPGSDPAALHELRKRCKELRYALEVFASLHEPAQHWRAVNELKTLQDVLGEFQDTEVQRARLRGFAAQMMGGEGAPATALLAMGEIGAQLAVRQHAARAEFAGRFAAFSSPQGRARITALTGPAR